MKKFAKVATPAAIAVLRQATAISPSRKKASDGLLPSAAHRKQSPNSDHNTGLAVDLTHDPKKGIDCVDIFQKLKEDKRVKYLIFKGKIWSKSELMKVTVSTPVAISTTATCIFLSMEVWAKTHHLGSGGLTNQRLLSR
jgi:hypothetical protein